MLQLHTHHDGPVPDTVWSLQPSLVIIKDGSDSSITTDLNVAQIPDMPVRLLNVIYKIHSMLSNEEEGEEEEGEEERKKAEREGEE